MTKRIYSFPPVIDAGCHTLILGTMPSVKSLEGAFYYAHPRNAFWPIMCELLCGEYISDYEARGRMLTSHSIALWDVCHCCERETSSDSMIRNEVANDIPSFAKNMQLEKVLLNGGTAAALYRRHIKGLDIPTLRLPSTSPAYTIKYDEKKSAWRAALAGAGIAVK